VDYRRIWHIQLLKAEKRVLKKRGLGVMAGIKDGRISKKRRGKKNDIERGLSGGGTVKLEHVMRPEKRKSPSRSASKGKERGTG